MSIAARKMGDFQDPILDEPFHRAKRRYAIRDVQCVKCLKHFLGRDIINDTCVFCLLDSGIPESLILLTWNKQQEPLQTTSDTVVNKTV